MTERPSHPTLLVFTLGPARERARRRLLPAGLGGVEKALHRQGLERALAAGRACGCRLEVSSPRRLRVAGDVRQIRQRGRSFGDRLRHAIRVAARRAAGPLLVVGTDVPGLTAGHLRTALARLRDAPGRIVLGPSPDGGFYLLAAERPPDEALARTRWCRRDTLASLIAALRSRGREVTLLTALRDLDRRADLETWLAREAGGLPGWETITRLLLVLLAALRRPLPFAAPAGVRAALARRRVVRGPPPATGQPQPVF